MTQGGFRRSGREWFSSLPACLLLLAVVLFSTSSGGRSRVLRGGEQVWGGYDQRRMDPVQPECDLDRDIEAEVARELAEQAPSDDPLAALLGAHEKDAREVRLARDRAVAECR